MFYEATPKAVRRSMDVKGLTLYHLKSHLQKYRLGMHVTKDSKADFEKQEYAVHNSTANAGSTVTAACPTPVSHSEISQTLAIQLAVQKQLQEQLEIQRQLQVQIESQSKYLQFMLEKAREAFGGHIGDLGVELAHADSTDLATKVSPERYGLSLPELEFSLPELPRPAQPHSRFADLASESKYRLSSGNNETPKVSDSDHVQGPTKKVKAFFCDVNGRIWRNEDDGDVKLQGYSSQSQRDGLVKDSQSQPCHSSLGGNPGSYSQSVEEDDGDSSCPSSVISKDFIAADLAEDRMTSLTG